MRLMLTWILAFCCSQVFAQQRIDLNSGWKTMAGNDSAQITDGWKEVSIPHNWDAYNGYRRLLHGNRHGYAIYQRPLNVPQLKGRRAYLFFEGVGSYATVWLNGKLAGRHAGGRTSFTLDITDLLKPGANELKVRADHPANIRDLPWVCGGCSSERGFSEGSQPMGIFRPVQLILREAVHVIPFGLHVWHDSVLNKDAMVMNVEALIRNDGPSAKTVDVITDISGAGKRATKLTIAAKTEKKLSFQQNVQKPLLWSPEHPNLYQLNVQVLQGVSVDKSNTSFGIRTIKWSQSGDDRRFYLNGQPYFLNGIAEYEHLLGSSHAFTSQQIQTRVSMIQQGGFNAFREAHHPHNLRYQQAWDSLGVFNWTQLSAHVWFDTKEFREQFLANLREWVIERRNSPSVILWGLQNESKLPADFARQCTELIRELDPTSPSQRLVTTCNGGEGTDWDVPQNWTGTYGGDPDKYDQDLKRQVLVGEYGAWRTIDLHTEGGFRQDGPYSEERFSALMQKKFRLGYSVRDSSAGHFMWLLNSHDNPGRVQNGEGYREMDRIGPVNYKGLFTSWEEPTEAYYMFRASSPHITTPVIYLAGHSWPQRWTRAGTYDSILVYSNCFYVSLWQNRIRLGEAYTRGIGVPFQFNKIPLKTGWLMAVGLRHGRVVLDSIYLDFDPPKPQAPLEHDITASANGYNYIYRLNCGGPSIIDSRGNTWTGDHPAGKNKWGSSSWTSEFKGLPWNYASQRRTFEPVENTDNDALFQTFRYGRESLKFSFPVKPGNYRVELYFMEPWFGRAGIDAKGWRMFDVAINNKKVLSSFDLAGSGINKAVKKIFNVNVTADSLVIDFPFIQSSQAVISGIAIASKGSVTNKNEEPQTLFELNRTATWSSWFDVMQPLRKGSREVFTALPPELFGGYRINADPELSVRFKDSANLYALSDQLKALEGFSLTNAEATSSEGRRFKVFKKIVSTGWQFQPDPAVLKQIESLVVHPFTGLEPAYDFKPTITIRPGQATIEGEGLLKEDLDGKPAIVVKSNASNNAISWLLDPGVAQKMAFTISYRWSKVQPAKGRLELRAADGTLMMEQAVLFENTRAGKWNYINSSSGSMVNAGHYVLKLLVPEAEGLIIDKLEVQ